MLFFSLFLLKIKWALDKFCKELDDTSLGRELNRKTLTLDRYKRFLIHTHYYIVPGPELLARDVKRMEKEGDETFKKYLEAHFQIEDTLIPLILRDLEDLGVPYPEVKRIGPTKQTEELNRYVERLHTGPDPVFILVSDIAAKVLLDYYTPKIIAAVKPNLPDPAKGITFLTKDTKAQIDIKSALLEIMRKRINPGNKRRFLGELQTIFKLFKDWVNAI